MVAGGSGELVVTASVTGSVKVPEVVLLLLSVTCTVKLEVTAEDGGVPVNTPLGLNTSQVGCPVALQVYPVPDPPVAPKVCV